MPDDKKKPDPLIDDAATVNKPLSLDDDDDEERTSISLDLTPPAEKPAAPAPGQGLGDDDDEESTKVLDWDRAMRKSLDGDKTPKK